jgi:hypothetical protein
LSLTTVMVMVEPLFLALTRTPSSAPCSAVTLPVSAGAMVCTAAASAPASNPRSTRKLTLVDTERRGMTISLVILFVFVSRPTLDRSRRW